jgi:hypothetical protein
MPRRPRSGCGVLAALRVIAVDVNDGEPDQSASGPMLSTALPVKRF